jgi:predicted DNA-binding WGR domain protein
VRRFTYASGSSDKFWSVGRDGATVTVHFGRVGTDGQTQVKELPSGSEAEAHVTKLVTQKLKKGYTEDAAAATGPAEAATGGTGTAVEAGPTTIEVSPPKIEVSPPGIEASSPGIEASRLEIETNTSGIEASPPVVTPSPSEVEGSGSVVEPSPVAVEGASSIVDEDVLVFPDSWRELVYPRRGGRFVPVLGGDPGRAWQLVDEVRDKVVEVVERRNGNVDLSQTLAYLDARAGAPHDAAVVATIVEWALGNAKDKSRAEEVAAFVDMWVAEQGFDFAARAVMAQLHMQMNYSALYKRKRASKHYYERGEIEALVSRFRTHLAVASETDHAAAVAALGECRNSSHDLLVTAFLVPERADWLAATLAVSQYASPLLVSTLSDLDQLTALEVLPYHLFNDPGVGPTLVDALGPAIAPYLASLYDEHAGNFGTEIKHLLAALAVIPTDEAFDLLLRRAGKRWVRPYLQDAMNRFPVRAARRLAASPAADELLRGHARMHFGLLAKADLPDSVRAKLDQLPQPVAEADPATLPPLLVNPPWTGKRAAVKPTVIAGLTSNVETGISWLNGEREAWTMDGDWDSYWIARQHPNQILSRVRSGDLENSAAFIIAFAPDELSRQVLNEWRPTVLWAVEHWLPGIAARYELEALPALLHLATHGGGAKAVETLLPFSSTEIATRMADALARLKSARTAARAWFQRHPEIAARALIPAALGKPGKPGKERNTAEAALRTLDPATVTKAAAEYGDKAEAGVAALLAADPLDVLPARIPKFPAWLDLAVLPQLVLRDGGVALPHTAVTHVVTMLAMSKADEVYAGVDIVKDLCTPDSLAEFAWGLFGAWQSADMPAKDGWALTALSWLGDDETVRRLTPLIRAWPGEGGHARAVNALDVLAAIGTDVALMHLHGIAQKVKFSGLRAKAKEKIAQVAADLELTPDQLADRLVPDLGLDENGSMVLDYGPRRFVVGFDERLTPYVVDETGTRRKDLPKPGVRDDQDKAPAAHKQFAALKKDVRMLATDQVRRLQQAMVNGRRWTVTEFTDLFVGHPLLRHVTRRLVWARFDGENATFTFRVAEDSTFADVSDEEVPLPADATIGIPHPLHLGDDLAAWVEIFSDYEILQPFPQLGRPVHALTGEERALGELAMFKDITVPTGKVLGLTNRGWQRGDPQDGGVEMWIERPVPSGHTVIVNLEPGIAVGLVDEFPEQKLESVWLSANGGSYWEPKGGLLFGELDPVTASEVLTELTELTGTTR